MSLDNTNWLKQSLNMGRQIDPGNDITLVNFAGRLAFQFDVAKLKRAEFSNGTTRDNFNRQFEYTGSLYLPWNTVDISNGGLVLMQWHGIAPDGRLPLTLQLQDGLLFFNHQQQGSGHQRLYECPIPYDSWIDLRFELQFGEYFRIWMNDVRVVDFDQHAEESLPPYWKYGSYRTGVLTDFPRVTHYWSDVYRRVF